jgi:hypothetical protein
MGQGRKVVHAGVKAVQCKDAEGGFQGLHEEIDVGP